MNLERVVASLDQKLSKDVGYRVDLHFCDARRINNTTAHFMLGYDGVAPTSDEVQEFFVRQYEAKVLPSVATARVYKDVGVVTVVGSMLTQVREISDIKRHNMVPVIAGLSYLDAALDEVWDVKDDGKGGKNLYRKERDNIMGIVEARRQKMTSNSTKTFASVATDSNFLKRLAFLEAGDTVKVLIGGKLVEAEIVTADDKNVLVNLFNGKAPEEMPHGNVIEVLMKGSEKKGNEAKKLQDYFSQAYGDPKYAKELVKK